MDECWVERRWPVTQCYCMDECWVEGRWPVTQCYCMDECWVEGRWPVTQCYCMDECWVEGRWPVTQCYRRDGGQLHSAIAWTSVGWRVDGQLLRRVVLMAKKHQIIQRKKKFSRTLKKQIENLIMWLINRLKLLHMNI